MKTTIWISIAGLALTSPLLGQTDLDDALRLRQIKVTPLGNVVSALPLAGEAAPISGKPYCGIGRTVEYSPDGVHVDRSESNRICRDEQGRTRREVNGGKIVSIMDPVAGVAYTLQTDARTAMKRNMAPLRPTLQPANTDPINLRMVNQTPKTMFETVAKLGGLNVVWDPNMAALGSQFTIDLKNSTVEEALNYVATLAKSYWRPIGPNTIFVSDDPAKGAAPVGQPTPEMSLMEAYRAQATRMIAGGRGGAAPNVIVDDLGTQVVNGVAAKGMRTTATIATGTFGNDHEIKTVTERWVSDDLHALVKSVYTDSRTGSTVYDLINISQTTPDSWLFQVPAGYTVQEAGAAGGRGGRGGPMPPAGGR